MSKEYRSIVRDGLWTNNAGLVQLLGLCPLLAVSNTLINGLGLGIATFFVMVGSNGIISAMRGFIRPEVRIPVFVLTIASLVTMVDLLMSAYLFDLYRVLGIFIPLIVTNCAIIVRAGIYASHNRFVPSLIDGIATGAGFAAVLVVLGGLRELIGQGSLFTGADMLFGPAFADFEIRLLDSGFLLATLPPGAFIGLGLMIAAKNALHARRTEQSAVVAESSA
jgi:electron transport complex protein RnfE